MVDACSVPQPGDPLVESLSASTDCHVQALVQAGYGALFAPGGVLAGVLTAGLTLYIAFTGYRLMLGRGSLSVSGFVVAAVKIGAVLALATQWPLYEGLVYGLLVQGPQQVAEALLRAGGGHGADLLAALQQAIDTLSLFSPADPPGPLHHDPNAAAALPSSLPQLMTPAAFDAQMLLISAFLLLLTTLGLLVAAKIVLGLLLMVGPIFIALFLLDATRGLFVGWLRAALSAALLPLLAALVMALALVMLAPSLELVRRMADTDTYVPGVAVRVFALVAVLALIAAGLVVTSGVAAFGLKLPRRSAGGRTGRLAAAPAAAPPAIVSVEPGRSGRIASALQRQDGARVMTEARRDPTTGAGAQAAPQPRRLGSEMTRRVQRGRRSAV